MKTDLYAYLKNKESPLAGYVSAIYNAANKYSIDPKLIVAISGAESSFGKYLSGDHNAWGIGPGRSYGSWREGIHAAAKLLREGYIGEGLTSLRKIQAKWAPLGAGNDPTNLNSAWLRNTSSFYEELGGNPNRVSSDWRKGASPTSKDNQSFIEEPEEPEQPDILQDLFQIPTDLSFDLSNPTMMDVALGRVAPSSFLESLLAQEEEVSRARPSSTQSPTASPPIGGGTQPSAGPAELKPMKRLNPGLSTLAEQWGLTVTSGFRSVAEQTAIYNAGGVAAKPGSSYHNYGRAIDIAPNQAAMRFVEYARAHPRQFREVFWDGPGSIYIKNGKLYPGRKLGGHGDHVHIAR